MLSWCWKRCWRWRVELGGAIVGIDQGVASLYGDAFPGVTEEDVESFFHDQSDPEASAMAALPARDREAHRAHWARIMADPDCTTLAIEADGVLAGNVVSWEAEGRRFVGYWIDKRHWGQGIATRALSIGGAVVSYTLMNDSSRLPVTGLVAHAGATTASVDTRARARQRDPRVVRIVAPSWGVRCRTAGVV